LKTIGIFLEHSLAISAWKEYGGSRWALRCNPSSGNLHPTEGYIIAGPVAGEWDEPGVFHYAPAEHGLERRARFALGLWQTTAGEFPADTFFVGLSSIAWREAWKYGERAYRYCQLDTGHAIAALRLAAAALGWRVCCLEGLSDTAVAALLGLDRISDTKGAELEHPDWIAAVFPAAHHASVPATLPDDFISAVRDGGWLGTPNRLSQKHVPWPAIDAVYQACMKPATDAPYYSFVADVSEVIGESSSQAEACTPNLEQAEACTPNFGAFQIIRQRRSAVAMDGISKFSACHFYAMLRRLLPAAGFAPWDTTLQTPHVHLIFFAHRVQGLPAGAYCLVRNPDEEVSLRAAMQSSFDWLRPTDCPPEIPLYRLQAGDLQSLAQTLSCHQEIAADGAFCVVMIAHFEPVLRQSGAWMYPRLFWEAGMIGQVLYLEAEAAGLRGTGIGCYFDDGVHEWLGIQDRSFQALYHFTVGGPVHDPRLRTLPPYGEMRKSGRVRKG
ncbi:MAG TPA: SagB/ThcOx family dehydrogenase, partial [Candidatus Hydrogenedentes bacterium]|nr:SagB/ThcOx family dehydrogenase [Candidatus Hydrogenedentota bacterium]